MLSTHLHKTTRFSPSVDSEREKSLQGATIFIFSLWILQTLLNTKLHFAVVALKKHFPFLT
jgi:hypothetical protein